MSLLVVNFETFKDCVISLLEVGQSTAPANIDTTYDIATFLMNRMGVSVVEFNFNKVASV